MVFALIYISLHVLCALHGEISTTQLKRCRAWLATAVQRIQKAKIQKTLDLICGFLTLTSTNAGYGSS